MNDKRSEYSLFNPSGCLGLQGMVDYLNGSLSKNDKEKADHHIDTCSLCKEAIEGMMEEGKQLDLTGIVNDINLAIRDRHRVFVKTDAKTLHISGNRSFYWSAAAVIVILAGVLFSLNNSFRRQNMPNIGNTIEVKEKPVPPMPGSINQPLNQPEIQNATVERGYEEEGLTPEKEEDQARTESLTVETKETYSSAPARLEKTPGSADSSLEAFLREEEAVSPGGRNDRYPDIASTLPVEYYLAEVIVTGPIISQNDTEGILPMKSEMRKTTKTEYLVSMSDNSEKKEKIHSSGKPDAADSGLKNHFFNAVETMPVFPGGYEGLQKYLSQNLHYPEKANKDHIQGRVLLSFVIDKEGHTSEVTLLKGIGGGCDEEAIRVIRSMPAWEPARQNGRPVAVLFTLPVYFRIL